MRWLAEAVGPNNPPPCPATENANCSQSPRVLPTQLSPSSTARDNKTDRSQRPPAPYVQPPSSKPAQRPVTESVSPFQSPPVLSPLGEHEHHPRHSLPSRALPPVDTRHDDSEFPNYATFFLADTLGDMDTCPPQEEKVCEVSSGKTEGYWIRGREEHTVPCDRCPPLPAMSLITRLDTEHNLSYVKDPRTSRPETSTGSKGKLMGKRSTLSTPHFNEEDLKDSN